MDNPGFDDIIKGKLSEYEIQTFDPAALAGLHHSMAAQRSAGILTGLRTEFWAVSGFAVLLLVTLLYQWRFNTNLTNRIEEQTGLIEQQQLEIASIGEKFSSLSEFVPFTDTVTVVEIRYMPANDDGLVTEESEFDGTAIDRVYLGEKSKVPAPVLAVLKEYGMLVADPSGDYYLISAENELVRIQQPELVLPNWADSLERITMRAANSNFNPKDTEAKNAKQLDLKTIRELKKHNSKGIGVKVGPAIEVLNGVYSVGGGNIILTGGALVDLITSPSIGVETGLKYSGRSTEATDNTEFVNLQLPGYDPTAGNLIKVESDSKVIEIPLNLKFNKLISPNTSLIAGVGVSGLIYPRQEVEYSYEIPDQPPDSPQLTTRSDYKLGQLQAYPGLINFILGTQNHLENGKLLETSFQYQHGMGESGVLGLEPSYYGLRLIYWFTAR